MGKMQALSTICSLIVDCPHSTPVWTDSGYVVLRNQNIKGGKLDLSSPSFTDQEHFISRNRRAKPLAGDLVITREAPMGEVCMVPDGLECCLGQRQVLLRPNPKLVSPRFVLYVLQSEVVQHQILWNEGTGSTVSNIRIPVLEALNIPMPSLPEQRAIAQILGSLDDKIDLNRQMNETLEAMARAIFKDWFVDFGPVRAKAEGRPPYLAPELWALFPDALDDEDKPVGWYFGALSDIANSPKRGINPKEISDETPYIGLEHMPRRSIALTEWGSAEMISSNKLFFKKGEFLFGKLRPYFHKVGIAPVDGICSTDIIVVKPKKSIWFAFVISCISTESFIDYTDKASTGTRMPRTSWSDMGRYVICLPPISIVSTFQSLIQPMIDKIVINIHENKTLAELRDLLLPKLMSGEIRLREAEKVVEAVL